MAYQRKDTPNFMVEIDPSGEQILLPYYDPASKSTHAPGAMRGHLRDLWYEGVEKDFDSGKIKDFGDLRRLKNVRARQPMDFGEDAPESSFLWGKEAHKDIIPRYSRAQENLLDKLGGISVSGISELDPSVRGYASGSSPLDALAMQALSSLSKPYTPRFSVPTEQQSALEGMLEVLSDPAHAQYVDPAIEKLGAFLQKGGVGRIADRAMGLFRNK